MKQMDGKYCLNFFSLEIKAPHRLGGQTDQTGLPYHLEAQRASLLQRGLIRSCLPLYFPRFFPSKLKSLLLSTQGKVQEGQLSGSM